MPESKLLTGVLLMTTVIVIVFHGIKSAQAQGPANHERQDAAEVVKVLKCLQNTPIGRSASYRSMLNEATLISEGKQKPSEQRRVCI